MKVLQVNCVYKKGSTGKITYDLHRGLLDAGIESIVCYGRGERVSELGVYKTCPEWYSHLNKLWSMITGVMYGGCFFSTKTLISIIKKEKPDVVHLQCINGYFVNIYRLVSWLKKHHIKTVLTLHAEFMYTGGCGYSIDCNQWSTRTGCDHSTQCPRWRVETMSLFFDRTGTMWRRMKDTFDGFDELIVTSVSPWLMERAKRSTILRDMNHTVVLNGLDTGVFHPYKTDELRKKMAADNRKIVFHATASFSTQKGHLKGGWYICELARKLPDVQFIVAGAYEKNCIVPENVKLIGRIIDQEELAKLYSLADITIISSKRETFSMIVAESLCCGTPVVGFKAGGPETISIAEYSRFVQYGDVESLSIAINDVFMSRWNNDMIGNKASNCYSIERMVESYLSVYDELMGGKEQ